MFGAYYLTVVKDGAKGEGRVFRHLHEVERAYEAGDIDLQARISGAAGPGGSLAGPTPWPDGSADRRRRATDDVLDAVETTEIETTPGRIIFNTALPDDFPFVNDIVGKRNRSIGSIVETLADRYPRAVVADSLDKIKDLCFRYAAQSGLTISIDDVKTPPTKADIIAKLRGRGPEGGDPVQAGHHHRRRAAPEGDRDLDVGQLRGRQGHGGDPRADPLQPARHDGRLRRPREPAAGAPDRRHEGPGVQPPGRDDPPPDPVARSGRACRSSSTSSPPTAPARAWPTPPCAPPTPGT